jgi:non-ribosomal peptide synthetase component F
MLHLSKQRTDESYVYWRALLEQASMPQIGSPPIIHACLPSAMQWIAPQSVKIKFVESARDFTVATIVKASWAFVLAKYLSISDVVFGDLVSGRNALDPLIDNATGCCINTVPMRIVLQESWTITDLLRHVQDQQLSRMPHELLGSREIMRGCTDFPPSTTFTSLLNHQNRQPPRELSIGGVEYSASLRVGRNGSANASHVSITSSSRLDELQIGLEYSVDKLSSQAANALLGALCDVADRFLTAPRDCLLSSLDCGQCPMLSTEEQERRGKGAAVCKFDGDLLDAAQIAFDVSRQGSTVELEDVLNGSFLI